MMRGLFVEKEEGGTEGGEGGSSWREFSEMNGGKNHVLCNAGNVSNCTRSIRPVHLSSGIACIVESSFKTCTDRR